jgi:hypothetical protein
MTFFMRPHTRNFKLGGIVFMFYRWFVLIKKWENATFSAGLTCWMIAHPFWVTAARPTSAVLAPDDCTLLLYFFKFKKNKHHDRFILA